MIENYINSTEKIELYLYSNGERVSADSTPTVTAVDINTGDVVSVQAVQTVQVTGEGYDYYWTALDPSEVTNIRTIKVTWSFAIGGNSMIRADYVEIVQPLVSIDEILQEYPQFDTGGANPKTIAELKRMERKVRRVIGAYTGQDFADKGTHTFKEYGSGSNFLGLSEPIYELEYVAADDPEVVLYDPDNDVNILDWDKELPWTIRKRIQLSEDWNSLYPKKHISPDWLDTKKIFEDKRPFTIRAKVGWQVVPSDVSEAALILIGDYFCPDIAFHEKQIESVTSADYNYKYDTEHFETTGNVVADQLLSRYIENRMHIF